MKRAGLCLLAFISVLVVCGCFTYSPAPDILAPPPKNPKPVQSSPLAQQSPSPVSQSIATGSATERTNPIMGTLESPELLDITILYDNNTFDDRLRTAWGFSALVRYGETTILFDTGGDAPTLMSNIDILQVDPAGVDVIVLSHIHNDHVGGLDGFLEQASQPTIYLPPSFPSAFKQRISQRTQIVEVDPGQEIVGGAVSTGEMGSSILEQALAIHTREGLVVITGCAHPGIVEIVEKAKEITGEQVHLVLGGFHLGNTPNSEIETIIENFRKLGVKKVAPTHCTGDPAIAKFEDEYGEDFIRAGVGLEIHIR